MADNDGVLGAAGLYIPRAGRLASSGHHNLAWELNDDPRFDGRHGTFTDVLDEIAAHRPRRVCLSSEDFEYAHARPAALRTLAGGLQRIGYDPVVIVYLRPQADYAESLYAELVRHGLADSFEAFLTAVIATGEFRFNAGWRFAFDYERLLDNFAAVFGAGRIAVRRYGGGDVVADFLRVVGVAESTLPGRITNAPRLHGSLQFGEVLRRLERNARSRDQPTAAASIGRGLACNARFDPVHVGEVRRLVGRFNAGNRRVYQRYGARIPCVSGRDLVSDVAAALGGNPASKYRKHVVAAHAQARGQAQPPAPAPAGPRSTAIERRNEPLFATEFRRPSLLEAALFVTSATVALAAFVYGWRTASTALVEFGMLSTIVAASALALLVRYAVESRGIIADDAYFDEVGARLSLIGYASVGAYALINAVLDVALGRYAPDWISYPGTIAAAAAALILTLILPARRRLAGELSRLRWREDLQRDRLYLACSYIVLLGQLGHAVSPVWWLDTTIDLFVVALAGFTAYQIRRAAGAPAPAAA